MTISNRILVMGPPLSGKTSLAVKLSKHLNISHVSWGGIVRDILNSDSELSDDETLIKQSHLSKIKHPTELVTSLLVDKYLNKEPHFVLEGFPKNIEELMSLSCKLTSDITCCIALDVHTDLLKQRSSIRLVCPNCNSSYSKEDHTTCPNDGFSLLRRDDESYIDERLKWYLEDATPVIQHLKSQIPFLTVDGNKGYDAVFQQSIDFLTK